MLGARPTKGQGMRVWATFKSPHAGRGGCEGESERNPLYFIKFC